MAHSLADPGADDEIVHGPDRSHLRRFFTSLPHRVADAGLTAHAATEVADLLEALVQAVESAQFPRTEATGPDPDDFPPPSDRIAAAGNDLEALFGGLGDEGWSAPTDGGTTVTERLEADHAVLVERYGLEATR